MRTPAHTSRRRMVLAGLGIPLFTVVVLASSAEKLSATGVIQADEVRILD